MNYSEGLNYKSFASVGQFEEVSLLYEKRAEVYEQVEKYVEAEKLIENVRCKLVIITGVYLITIASFVGLGTGLIIGNSGDATLFLAGKVCLGLGGGIAVVAPACFYSYVLCKKYQNDQYI